MKNLKGMFSILLLLICISCASDDMTIDQMSLSTTEKEAILAIVKTNLSIEAESEIVITSTKLKKIDEIYYLSSTHGDYVTTTLLRVGENNQLKYGGISCTSTRCAYDDGCIPHADGKRCTACSRGDDCKKTVTSNEPVIK